MVQPLWQIDAARAAPGGGLDQQPPQSAIDVRHQHLHLRHIARLLQAPFSTVARVLNRTGLGRLRTLQPKPPVQRYAWEQPGDMILVDI